MIRWLLGGTIWIVVITGALLFWGPVILVTLFMFGVSSGESDSLADYPTALSVWKSSGLVKHFPQQISPNATRGWFSAAPGFLQGGAHIQLRLRLPPAEIQAIEQQAAATAKRIYPGGGDSLTYVQRDGDNGLATADFHTHDPGKGYSFPPHFTMYVLYTRASGKM